MPRPKTFSIDVALAGAMELFWKHGYRATSMQQVADQLKLSRSSIYRTFGTKARLFVQVLGRYGGANCAPGLRELCTSQTPRAALVKVFEVVGSRNDRQAPGVYLLIDATMLLTHSEPEISRIVDKAMREMERSFRDAIERGKATAEIAASVDSATAAGCCSVSISARMCSCAPVLIESPYGMQCYSRYKRSCRRATASTHRQPPARDPLPPGLTGAAESPERTRVATSTVCVNQPWNMPSNPPTPASIYAGARTGPSACRRLRHPRRHGQAPPPPTPSIRRSPRTRTGTTYGTRASWRRCPTHSTAILSSRYSAPCRSATGTAGPCHPTASALRSAAQAPASTAAPDAHDRTSFVLPVSSRPRPADPTSLQVASRASPDRVAVKIVYSNSSLVAAHALDARILASAPATA